MKSENREVAFDQLTEKSILISEILKNEFIDC
jgi:hypothetical protein